MLLKFVLFLYLVRYFFVIFSLFPLDNAENQQIYSLKNLNLAKDKKNMIGKEKYKKTKDLKMYQKRKPSSLSYKPELEQARRFRRKKMVKVKIYFDDIWEKAYHKMISFLISFNIKYTFIQLEPFPIIFCELSPSQMENLKLDFQVEE